MVEHGKPSRCETAKDMGGGTGEDTEEGPAEGTGQENARGHRAQTG